MTSMLTAFLYKSCKNCNTSSKYLRLLHPVCIVHGHWLRLAVFRTVLFSSDFCCTWTSDVYKRLYQDDGELRFHVSHYYNSSRRYSALGMRMKNVITTTIIQNITTTLINNSTTTLQYGTAQIGLYIDIIQRTTALFGLQEINFWC